MPAAIQPKSNTPQSAKFVDEFALAEALDISVSYLRKDRQTRRRIPFVKIGAKAVRYDLAKILAQIERNGGI